MFYTEITEYFCLVVHSLWLILCYGFNLVAEEYTNCLSFGRSFSNTARSRALTGKLNCHHIRLRSSEIIKFAHARASVKIHINAKQKQVLQLACTQINNNKNY